MKTDLAYNARKILVNVGKIIPFFLCFITLISHVENIIAIYSCDYIVYAGEMVLNTPISFAIGNIFKYDFLLLAIITVLCIAIKTCIYNKLCVLYLLLLLCEKEYFIHTTVEIETACVVSIFNLIISICLTLTGLFKL